MRCFNRGCAAMWPVLVVVCLVGVGSAFGQSAGQGWLVEDGEPRAQIVVRDDPPRTTRLAPQELQTYIEKMSGATLPIVTALRDDLPVKLAAQHERHVHNGHLPHIARRSVARSLAAVMWGMWKSSGEYRPESVGRPAAELEPARP